MRKYYLFSMDENKFDLEAELKQDYVDWTLNRCKDATKNDIVYIYVSKPYSGIKFCATVEKVFDKDNTKYVRLVNFKQVKEEFIQDLKIDKLKEEGFLSNAPRGKQTIENKNFLDLLNNDKLFEKIENSEEKEKVLDLQIKQEVLNETKITQFEYSKDKNIKPKIIERNGYRYTERNNKQINLGLYIANRQCEYDNTHKSFIKQNGEKYVEAHHLIPFNKCLEVDAGLDVAENIICLCSECHNMLHYGQNMVRHDMLKFFYDKRKDLLKGKDLDLSFETLLEYYKLKIR